MQTEESAFNTKLVQAVKRRTWLYDYTMKEYGNRDLIQATWDKIAEEVDSTAKKCKEVWRSLRVNYYRCLKKPPSVSRATKKQCFLIHNMGFLKRYMGSKKIMRKKLSLFPQNKKRSAPSKPTASKDQNQNSEDSKAHSSNTPNLTVESLNSMVSKTSQDSSTELPPKNKNPHNTCAESSESKTEDRYSSNKMFVLSLVEDLGQMEANNLWTFKHEVWNMIKNILLSQQTRPKPFDKVLSQSFNEDSSEPKPTTSSKALSLQHQAKPWKFDEDTDDEDIFSYCKVDVSS